MISEIREKSPLIHAITNPISITMCANACLALGAKPIMAEHPREVREITRRASALLVNLGNITDARIKSIYKATKEKTTPVVLDLVGISCSKLRYRFAEKLVGRRRFAIIKGNYSEICALYNGHKTSGVDADANLSEEFVVKATKALASKYNAVILASGKVDIVSDENCTFKIRNGVETLSQVTGTGCLLGAICATLLSVTDALNAAVCACAVLGICGELAEGEGFEVKLMDSLRAINDEKLQRAKKVEKYEA